MLATMSCSGPSRIGGSYVIDGARFAINELPGRWRPAYTDGGLTFVRADEQGTIITLSATCTEPGDAPLDVLTNHLVIGLTERNFLSRELVAFDGREAERTTLTAKLDGVPVKMATMVLKKDWCIYDAIYAARPRRFDAHLSDFETLLEGFRTLGRSS